MFVLSDLVKLFDELFDLLSVLSVVSLGLLLLGRIFGQIHQDVRLFKWLASRLLAAAGTTAQNQLPIAVTDRELAIDTMVNDWNPFARFPF